jgi:PhnB protein
VRDGSTPVINAISFLLIVGTSVLALVYSRAIKAGAESLSEPEDKFWGTRSALIKDPYGYRWSFNQMVEELSPEEMAKRAEVFFKSMQ